MHHYQLIELLQSKYAMIVDVQIYKMASNPKVVTPLQYTSQPSPSFKGNHYSIILIVASTKGHTHINNTLSSLTKVPL